MVACVLGAFDSQDWSPQSLGAVSSLSLLEVYGSPPHDGSFLDGLDVLVFGLDVQELSTHPDAEQRKGISRRTPYSKRDPHQNRTIPHEPIYSKNWSVYQALRGSDTLLDSILYHPGAGARTACEISGRCRVGAPLPWSIPGQANGPGLARAFPSLWWLAT